MRTILTSALILAWVGSSPAITIDTVAVGDAGNPNDTATGNLYGGVNYAYSIGKYEVTVSQYTDFLNAVAASDPYALYSTRMQTDLNIAGIARNGSSGNFSYSVIGSPNHPITYVNWGDAARFANWLNNGQPTGAEGPATTETGAYTLNGATSSAALYAVTRNFSSKWFIPTENEWYKAAFYQPAAAGGDSDGYWTYATRTNSAPYSDQPPGATPDNMRVANFYHDDSLANGYDDGFAVAGSPGESASLNRLTDVGAYPLSSSYYGTFDQNGNVDEWNEAQIDGAVRGYRGGDWASMTSTLASSTRPDSFRIDPTSEFSSLGFRVASIAVPEPGTTILASIMIVALYGSHRRQTLQNRA